MKDIFITGSTGAIGQRILPKLEEKNFNITPINLRKKSNSGGEAKSSEDSWMIHLASINSKITKEDISVEKNMIKSAINIALVNGVKNFIFFSTSKLYPATSNKNLSSEDSDPYLADPYSKGKMECELVLKANSEKFKSVSIFRLAPVLIRSPSSNINLLLKMCEILPLMPLFSAGDKNFRSFLSLQNLEMFLEAYLNKDMEGINILNLCDPSPITTNMLINGFLDKHRANLTRLRLPKFLEHLALNMPILGKKLNSLYADHVIDNYKITNEFPDLNFQQTSEAIRLYGLY
jgi:nucleoside-diphosphate-sugar epimerase